MGNSNRDIISHGAICTFCYSVLLWPVASRVASMNSAGISEFDELVGHVFPSFVVLQFFDFRIELVFSSSLEQLEGLKCLALSLQAHGSSVGRRIVKECDPVAVSFTGGNRERTMQIRVNQFKWHCRTRRRRWEWVGVHFTSKARLANNVWLVR